MSTAKLSAVIACYRDAPAIPQMHERLTTTFQQLGVDYEIVFVNDASPDDARPVLLLAYESWFLQRRTHLLPATDARPSLARPWFARDPAATPTRAEDAWISHLPARQDPG